MSEHFQENMMETPQTTSHIFDITLENLPSNAVVTLQGNFQATNNNPNRGWDLRHRMLPSQSTPNLYMATVNNLVTGKEYEWKVFWEYTDGNGVRHCGENPTGYGNNRKTTIWPGINTPASMPSQPAATPQTTPPQATPPPAPPPTPAEPATSTPDSTQDEPIPPGEPVDHLAPEEPENDEGPSTTQKITAWVKQHVKLVTGGVLIAAAAGTIGTHLYFQNERADELNRITKMLEASEKNPKPALQAVRGTAKRNGKKLEAGLTEPRMSIDGTDEKYEVHIKLDPPTKAGNGVLRSLAVLEIKTPDGTVKYLLNDPILANENLTTWVSDATLLNE